MRDIRNPKPSSIEKCTPFWCRYLKIIIMSEKPGFEMDYLRGRGRDKRLIAILE